MSDLPSVLDQEAVSARVTRDSENALDNRPCRISVRIADHLDRIRTVLAGILRYTPVSGCNLSAS